MNGSQQGMYEILLEHIRRLPAVDTHEHLLTEADFLSRSWDFGYVMAYTTLDAGAAGMYAGPWGLSQHVAYSDKPPLEKWREIEPYWLHARDTRYSTCTRRALRRFFGVDDWNEQSVVEVSDRISQYQYPGVYKKILQEECGIRVCLKIGNTYPEPQYFAPVFYLDTYAGMISRTELEIASPDGVPATAADYLDHLTTVLDDAKAKGIVCVKIGWVARRRPIDFVRHSAADVEDAYQCLKFSNEESWDAPGLMARLKPLHDTLFRFCFEWAGKNGIPVQIHSGLEFDQPWDGRPTALLPCLLELRDTHFAILHGSYPYMAELTGLARGFHNVTIDMAWLALLSGPAADVWLDEWLEVLPSNKLLAFGGDCLTFFEVCSHLEMAQEMLARALTKRVEQGKCTEEEAVQRAKQMLHDNPWNFYGLQERWADRCFPPPGGGEL